MARLLTLVGMLVTAHSAMAGLAPTDLRCEYTRTPLGIDIRQPRLSWALQGDGRGQVQTAYQVLVAGSEESLKAGKNDLWDSGKVESNATLNVEYAGSPLKSGQRCWWQVRVWGQAGESAASEPSWWEMALLDPQDWKGQWISGPRLPEMKDEEQYTEHPAPLLRREFDVGKRVVRARAYVSGLGYYELHLNGQKVGDRVLDPGWTTYSKRVLYSTYDVTPLLQSGKNAVGLILGNGWYNPLPLKMWGVYKIRDVLTIGQPRAILQLNIEYDDGSRESVVTDEQWRTGPSAILKNSIYLGEVYDARREQAGWDSAGFSDSEWQKVAIAPEKIGPMVAQSCPPIRATATLKPVAKTQPKPGVYIFDLGQNFAGWVTLRVSGPAGTAVKMRFGELLYPDGKLNVMTSVCGQIKKKGIGGPGAPDVAYASDTYILRGEGEERYTPRFTFHGFRYVEVTGYPGEPAMDAIEGTRLGSDIESVGSFSCSNEMFNRIHQICRWTQLSNVFSVQSDCPHRERFGYGGDMVADSEMGLFNFDMTQFYAKTVVDMQDAVRPNGGFTETNPFVGIDTDGLGEGSGPMDWGGAHPLLQVQLYRRYGNRRLMEEQYETLKRWIALLESKAKDDILNNGLGDHETLAPKDIPLSGTAFYHYNVKLAAEIAGVLGKAEDQQRWLGLADRIKAAFNREFVKSDTGKCGAGTQACQSFALYMDLAPESERAAVVKALVDDVHAKGDHLSTGIFGTKYLLNALSDNGQAELACAIVNQKTFPGWGNMLEGGATTLWEHWEFSDNTFSHNHPMFGSVDEWFYKFLGGIRPDDAAVGFDKVVIAPRVVGGLEWVRTEHRTIRGPVASRWRKQGGTFVLEVSIPPNTTATIHVPAAKAGTITEGGKLAEQAEGVKLLSRSKTEAVYGIGSGQYRFEVK